MHFRTRLGLFLSLNFWVFSQWLAIQAQARGCPELFVKQVPVRDIGKGALYRAVEDSDLSEVRLIIANSEPGFLGRLSVLESHHPVVAAFDLAIKRSYDPTANGKLDQSYEVVRALLEAGADPMIIPEVIALELPQSLFAALVQWNYPMRAEFVEWVRTTAAVELFQLQRIRGRNSAQRIQTLIDSREILDKYAPRDTAPSSASMN